VGGFTKMIVVILYRFLFSGQNGRRSGWKAKNTGYTRDGEVLISRNTNGKAGILECRRE